MTVRRTMIVVLLGGAVLAFPGSAARACSCALGDPRTALAEADAAFVGRLVSREQPTPGPGGVYSSAQPIVYTFDVERSVKGDVGREVDVQAPADGASCGLEVAEGERTGLLLYRHGEGWKSNLCSQMDPDTLIEAASPLPAPTSSGPVAFVLGGRYGDATAIALDRKGKTVAYGNGSEWDTTHIAVCPGSETVVEWGTPTYGGENIPFLSVRSFDRFRSARTRKMPQLRDAEPSFNRLVAISCRNETGTDVLIAVTEHEPGVASPDPANGRILRFTGEALKTEYEGILRAAVFSTRSDTAFVAGGRDGRDLLSVDLTTGVAERIGRLPCVAATLELNRAATRLASITELDPSDYATFRICVVELGSARARSLTLKDRGAFGTIIWADDDTIVFVPGGGDSDRVQVFDHRLLRLGSFTGWRSHGAVAVGGRLYGVGWGDLLTAELPRGPVKTLARFGTNLTYTLAVVPARPKPEPEPSPAETPSPAPSSPPPAKPTPAERALGGVREPETPRAAASVAGTLAAVMAAAWIVFRRRAKAG